MKHEHLMNILGSQTQPTTASEHKFGVHLKIYFSTDIVTPSKLVLQYAESFWFTDTNLGNTNYCIIQVIIYCMP